MSKYFYNSYVVEDKDFPNLFGDGRWWCSDMQSALEHFKTVKRGKLSIVTTWMRASGFVPQGYLCARGGETIVMSR